ncbi:MAG TPA: nuclear transport factor 2 family protein [Terriglobales bacterium]|nr:nuclear transport factor 2 family protein [Terriglobales bacterium]
MLMSSHQELITAIYRSFNARDIDAVLARMHRQVDWPNGMEGGRVHGHADVRAYWERQWKLVDPHVEPKQIADDAAGRTVVDVHQVVRDLKGGVLLDRMVRHVYTIRDSLIERMDIVDPPPQS